MALAGTEKTDLVNEYKTSENDSGSPEVQVAILTTRIRELTEHMKIHRKDFASRRGLLKMVAQRNALLRYLIKTDRERYKTLINRLGLRK